MLFNLRNVCGFCTRHLTLQQSSLGTVTRRFVAFSLHFAEINTDKRLGGRNHLEEEFVLI
jgi:hypothetical protein